MNIHKVHELPNIESQVVGIDIETTTTPDVFLQDTDNDNIGDACETPPIAHFTYTPNTPYQKDTISFKDTTNVGGGTITEYSWSFGDGGTSTQRNPDHIYDDDGN